MDRFNSSWTPSLIVHDAEGREYRRSLGYLDPMRFLGEMALARLLEKVHRRDYAGARDRAAEAIEFTKGDPTREPEALYFGSVVDYKVANDAGKLVALEQGIEVRHVHGQGALVPLRVREKSRERVAVPWRKSLINHKELSVARRSRREASTRPVCSAASRGSSALRATTGAAVSHNR